MFSLRRQGGRGRLGTHQSFIHLLQNFPSLLTTCTVKIILSWYCKFTVSKNISEKSQNHNVFSTFHCHKMQLLAFLDHFTTEIPFLILHPVRSLSLSYLKPEKRTLTRRSLRLLQAIIVSTPSGSQNNCRCCKVNTVNNIFIGVFFLTKMFAAFFTHNVRYKYTNYIFFFIATVVSIMLKNKSDRHFAHWSQTAYQDAIINLISFFGS